MNQKNAIVTGASRGIGRAIALQLADQGYNLLINSSRSEQDLTQVQNEILEKGVQCITFLGNVGNHQVATELYATALKHFGSIQVLINNAGISKVGLLQDMTFEEWDEIVNVNLTSVFNLSKLVTPDMVRAQYGKIINISSVWGLCGASCEVAYSSTKGAINAFTKALGKELAPSNVSVLAIACGAVDTAMNHCFSEEDRIALCEEIPAGRMATPEEVAEITLHLINSPTYLTGEVIKLDGGWI